MGQAPMAQNLVEREMPERVEKELFIALVPGRLVSTETRLSGFPDVICYGLQKQDYQVVLESLLKELGKRKDQKYYRLDRNVISVIVEFIYEVDVTFGNGANDWQYEKKMSRYITQEATESTELFTTILLFKGWVRNLKIIITRFVSASIMRSPSVRERARSSEFDRLLLEIARYYITTAHRKPIGTGRCEMDTNVGRGIMTDVIECSYSDGTTLTMVHFPDNANPIEHLQHFMNINAYVNIDRRHELPEHCNELEDLEYRTTVYSLRAGPHNEEFSVPTDFNKGV